MKYFIFLWVLVPLASFSQTTKKVLTNSSSTASETAFDYFKKGNELLFSFSANHKINFSEVLRNYNKSLALNPSNFECIGLRGIVKMETQDYPGALKDFDNSLKLLNVNDSSTDYLLRLAGALYFHKALAYVQLQNEREALGSFEKALQISPDLNTGVLNAQFDGYTINDKYYKAAVSFLDKVINNSDPEPNILLNRALLKYCLKDLNGALEDYNTALRINSHYALSYYNRGLLKQKMKMHSDAIADFTSAITIDPNDGEYYLYRALSEHGLNNIQDAFKDYMQDYNLTERRLSYRNIGLLYLEMKDYKSAISWYTKSIDVDPNDESNVEFYLNRGIAKDELNDYTGSIQDYNNVIRLCKGFSELYQAYLKRGLAKMKLNDNRGAIMDFSQLIKKDAGDVISAYFNRAIAKEDLKDISGALDDYNNCIKLKPDLAEAYFNRGLLKGEYQKNTNSACLDLSKAGELGLKEAYEVIKKYCK